MRFLDDVAGGLLRQSHDLVVAPALGPRTFVPVKPLSPRSDVADRAPMLVHEPLAVPDVVQRVGKFGAAIGLRLWLDGGLVAVLGGGPALRLLDGALGSRLLPGSVGSELRPGHFNPHKNSPW